jgi:hypothetical protein
MLRMLAAFLIVCWSQKTGQISLSHADDFGTHIYNACQTVSVMDRQTAEPTNKIKGRKSIAYLQRYRTVVTVITH